MQDSTKYKAIGATMMLIGCYILGVATGRYMADMAEKLDTKDIEAVVIEDEVAESYQSEERVEIIDESQLPDGVYLAGYDKHGNAIYHNEEHMPIDFDSEYER